MHALPKTLATFADVLASVPATIRPALAAEIMQEARDQAAQHVAYWEKRGEATKANAWGHWLENVCLQRRTTIWAPIDTRDGIQTYEVALAALMDAIRADERKVAA